jgi:hypothetical protein
MKNILEKKYSQRIYNISFLTLISFCTAFLLNHYDFVVLTLCILVNSLNYWRHPIPGIRRQIDIFCVILSFTYNTIRSFQSLYQSYYIITIFIGILCYLFARKCKSQNLSSFIHCFVHIFANVANIILYIGLKKRY